LDLAAFRELEAFAQLGTELDPATQARLDRGYRMVELLKQGQYRPLNVIDQVLVIFAGTRGYLDKLPIDRVAEWETKFLTFMSDQKSEVRAELAEKKDLDDALTAKIRASIEEFNTQFIGVTAPATVTV
jgi:F-type H+-transporting ATPase subunit alpha